MIWKRIIRLVCEKFIFENIVYCESYINFMSIVDLFVILLYYIDLILNVLLFDV